MMGETAARLQRHHHSAQIGIGLLQRRFRNESHIAAIGRGVGILGKVLRQHGEILAAFLACAARCPRSSALGLSLVLRLAVFQIPHVGIGHRRHHNLRQVHLRLRQIEARLVGVIKIGHVRVGDGDVRCDLLVDQLVHRQLLPHLRLEIVQGHVAARASCLSNSSLV